MKKLVSTMIFVLSITSINAVAEDGSLDAATLVGACKLMTSGKSTNAGVDSICIFAIKGFVDGFKSGVNKGLSTALINDKQAAHTVKGIKDLTNRIDAVRSLAYCAPASTTYGDFIRNYLDFMGRNPQRMSEDYKATLLDSIENKFPC